MLVAAFVVLGCIALAWLTFLARPAYGWAFRYPVASTTPPAQLVPPGFVDGDEPSQWPAVTVVVPARNEQAWLGGTVPTYCEQDYPDVRVVVVDDASTDDTPRILADLAGHYPNLRVVHASPRPDGWCGKPWAVREGTAFADTELLLFTDADCFFHPQAVRQAVRLLLRGGFDLVSFLPQMTYGTSIERVGLAGLGTVLNLIMPIGAANDPQSPVAIAAGGFILFRTSAYQSLGGHEAVKSQMIEDVVLARKSKAAGLKVHIRFTPDLVHTRMYEGAADLWHGLSKNAYAGMDYQPRKFWVGLIVGLLTFVLPPAYLAVSLGVALATGSKAAWAFAALSAFIVACQSLVHARMTRQLRLPWWHALLMPASAGLYCAIASHSAYQHHYGGGSAWSGRQYDRKMLLAAGADDEVTG